MNRKICLFLIFILLIVNIPIVFADYEDYTTYTEVDEDGDIDINSTWVNTTSMRRDADSYVYKDYGEDYFTGDFEYMVDVYIDMANDRDTAPCFFTLANDVGAQNTIADTNFITVFYYETSAWYLFVRERYNDANYQNNGAFTMNEDTWYYLNITRSGSTFRCDVYNDEARTSLRGYSQITLKTVDDYRYVYVNHNGNSTWEPDHYWTGMFRHHEFGIEAPADEYPQYSDISDDGETVVGEDVTCFGNFTDDFELQNCSLEHNSSGSVVNITVTISGTQDYVNGSFTLNYTAGIVVSYRWFVGDNASQWNVTGYYNITTIGLNITAYLNNSTMGSFFVNHISRSNATLVTGLDYNESVSLISAPYSNDYVFDSFNWTADNSAINPTTYYATANNDNVWCYFDEAGGGGSGITQEEYDDMYLLAGILAVVVCIGFAVIFIYGKDNRGGI